MICTESCKALDQLNEILCFVQCGSDRIPQPAKRRVHNPESLKTKIGYWGFNFLPTYFGTGVYHLYRERLARGKHQGAVEFELVDAEDGVHVSIERTVYIGGKDVK